MIKIKFFLPVLLLVIVATTSQIFLAQLAVASELPEPSDQGSPNGRKPAGGRGSCEKNSFPFTPLLPPPDDGFSGFTLKEHPTFWFFIPDKADNISSGSFILREKEGSKMAVYQVTFKLPKIPGFVSITIPNTAPPLEKNKQYIWKLTLYCASQDSDQPPTSYHEGLIERADIANLENQLQTAKLPGRINLYIKHKIWYDATNELAKLREFPDAWLVLLEAMKLEQLKQEAIGGEVVQNKE